MSQETFWHNKINKLRENAQKAAAKLQLARANHDPKLSTYKDAYRKAHGAVKLAQMHQGEYVRFFEERRETDLGEPVTKKPRQ